MEIVIIIGLILLNGVFSMSEIAVVSARRSRLETDVKNGSKSAAAVLKLINNPDRFLSTVQIGITLIGILTGLYSGEAFSADLGELFIAWGMSANYAFVVSKFLIVVVVTFITIVFGELVPKRIGMTSSEKVAKVIAKPMIVLSHIVQPFVWLLSKTSSVMFGLLKLKGSDSRVTEEEIKSLIRESTDGGEITEVEHDIVERVFALGDRNVSSIMTHQSDIEWIDINDPKPLIKEEILKDPHYIYPVGDESIDDIVGVVYLRDLFGKIDDDNFNISDVMTKPFFIHEGASVYNALESMKLNRAEYALVADEFGDIQGIITQKDILEGLVGTMPDQDEEEIVERSDGTYLIDGRYSFYDFLAHFDIEELYRPNEFNTISGLILKELDHIPKEGEQICWHGFTIEVMDMDGARIDKVLVSPPQEEGKDERLSDTEKPEQA